jgi:hypothetical protein
VLCTVDRLFNGGNYVFGSWELLANGFLLLALQLVLWTCVEMYISCTMSEEILVNSYFVLSVESSL